MVPLIAVAMLATPGLSARAASAIDLLRQLNAQDQAVEAVGFRLASANAPLCPRAGWDAGFSVQTLEQYGPRFRESATREFGLGPLPGVLAVAPGSPAEAAGLKANDAIASVGADTLPTLSDPPPERADFARTQAVQHAIAHGFEAGAASVTVLRTDGPITLRIQPARACRSLFQVVPDAAVNGAADGEYVQVSSEMAALATSADDLAAVLAHELAHNILGHRARLDALHVDRGWFADFGRNAGRIRETEAEADRLSIYLLARAGYHPDKAIAFWARLRRLQPISLDPTHPRWSDRLAAMRRELARIKALGSQPSLPDDLAQAIPAR